MIKLRHILRVGRIQEDRCPCKKGSWGAETGAHPEGGAPREDRIQLSRASECLGAGREVWDSSFQPWGSLEAGLPAFPGQKSVVSCHLSITAGLANSSSTFSLLCSSIFCYGFSERLAHVWASVVPPSVSTWSVHTLNCSIDVCPRTREE